MKLAIVSLGCPKNQVDADRFCRAFLEAGYETVPAVAQADVVIINTCGFIESAKEEAIEQIFDACAYKRENPALKVLVTGCLAERYQNELAREIPELDAVVGIGANAELVKIVEQVLARSEAVPPLEAYGPKTALPLEGPRVISTPPHYAYLKIAEGCSNACSYCAIPAIRGPFRSRPMEDVLQEAQWLAQQGVKELILVAQDVTAYGEDQGERQLVPLLKALDTIEGPHWIRLLYTYPERIDKELLQTIADSDKILPYLDMPIQHCNDSILRSMRRKGGAKAVLDALALVREHLPEATLRTSLIVGYPGESEAQFEELCQFVKQARFDRLGCFAYSPEEGTLAQSLPGHLPEQERQRRAEVIMRLQSNIMAQKQEAMLGQVIEVLCNEYLPDEDVFLCRSRADAPEIDANVMVEGDAPLQVGEFYHLRVTAADGLDLWAECTA